MEYPEHSFYYVERLDERSDAERRLQKPREELSIQASTDHFGHPHSDRDRYETIETGNQRVCAVCRIDVEQPDCVLHKEEQREQQYRKVTVWLSCSQGCTDAWVRRYGQVYRDIPNLPEPLKKARSHLLGDNFE